MRPVARSILVTVLAQAGMCVILFLSGFLVGAYALPFVSVYGVGFLSLFVPIVVGARWFRANTSEPMRHRDRLLFATGVAVMNAVLTIGINSTLASLGVSSTPSIEARLTIVMLLAFLSAYSLGWLLTIRPRRHPA